MLFRRYDDDQRDAATIVHTAAQQGGTWLEPVVLARTAGTGRPVLAVHDGRLHAAWATGVWSGPEDDPDDHDDPQAWEPPAYDALVRLAVLEDGAWREIHTVNVEGWTARPRTPTPALISHTAPAGPNRLMLVYPAPVAREQ
ncbi:hypothetical protein ACIRL2_49475 [Embleya sp. NPDC127516]|uniref:hypothetical protein n=1 Tax=Embleya sp. NPDC127516 TaxID=3363990 RepID=UPI003808C207